VRRLYRQPDCHFCVHCRRGYTCGQRSHALVEIRLNVTSTLVAVGYCQVKQYSKKSAYSQCRFFEWVACCDFWSIAVSCNYRGFCRLHRRCLDIRSMRPTSVTAGAECGLGNGTASIIFNYRTSKLGAASTLQRATSSNVTASTLLPSISFHCSKRFTMCASGTILQTQSNRRKNSLNNLLNIIARIIYRSGKRRWHNFIGR